MNHKPITIINQLIIKTQQSSNHQLAYQPSTINAPPLTIINNQWTSKYCFSSHNHHDNHQPLSITLVTSLTTISQVYWLINQLTSNHQRTNQWLIINHQRTSTHHPPATTSWLRPSARFLPRRCLGRCGWSLGASRCLAKRKLRNGRNVQWNQFGCQTVTGSWPLWVQRIGEIQCFNRSSWLLDLTDQNGLTNGQTNNWNLLCLVTNHCFKHWTTMNGEAKLSLQVQPVGPSCGMQAGMEMGFWLESAPIAIGLINHCPSWSKGD